MGVKSFILQDDEFVNSGKFVNKFMPLERALNLLNDKCLWFANPNEWPDPYEKRFINAKYDGGHPFAWKDRVFCSCFTNNASSEAQWNAYSNNDDMIKITFDRVELMHLLESYYAANPHNQVYFDKVEYMQTKYIEKPLSKIPFDPPISDGSSIRSMEFKARLLLLKRKAFDYEEEFRAIVIKPKATKEKGIRVDFANIHPLIKSITIGPKVGNDTFLMLKEILINKYGFTDKQILQSYLYRPLPNVINIKSK